MNGYQQQPYSAAEGYSAQPPPHPSQIPRNMNTFAAKPAHPYSSYYDGGAGNNDYSMYAAAQGGGQQQQQLRQGPPPELAGYMQAPPRSSMNPNAAAFMPRQYEMPNVSRAPQQQQSFNPFGYNTSSHRPMQQQQQPPQSQSPYRSGPPTNFLGYNQQQQQQQPPRNQVDYATVTGHYTPQQQQQPQRIPPPSYHQQQMSSQQQQQQQQFQQGGGQDPLSGLRTQLTQQKQLTEEEIKRQQQDQEEYASRFLAAVQERVSQQRPSSASAASSQHQQSSQQPSSISNGVANNTHGTSLQNLAATLQQEGLNGGGYFDQDINTYDFEAQHNANPPFQLSPELLDKIGSLPNKMILYEVQIGLEQLLAEPSEFDAWIVAIRDRLAQKDVTSDDLEAAAWLVIEMGIFGENAQYNFAKVCTYLYERLSSFKESLVLQIKEFHNYRSQYALETQQSLLSFIAELYVQAFAPVGVRNHPIPTILYEEFMDILCVEPMTDLLVKKVVQTLKLCGRHLETDIGENSMGELFKKLEDFTKEGQRPTTLTDTGVCFITNLLLYRSSGWGGSATDSTTTGTSATSAPIRFAPDNNMDLTEEEIRFLESNGVMEGGSSFSSGPSSNDIYDDEILEDYEKFLRDHAEQTAISAAEKALERLSMEEEDDIDSHVPHRDDNTTPTPSKS